LALFVDREDGGMSGWIDVEANDVLDLAGEFLVVRQLERANAVRRELMRFEDPLHRSQELISSQSNPENIHPQWSLPPNAPAKAVRRTK
jgi:hypothetical protein